MTTRMLTDDHHPVYDGMAKNDTVTFVEGGQRPDRRMSTRPPTVTGVQSSKTTNSNGYSGTIKVDGTRATPWATGVSIDQRHHLRRPSATSDNSTKDGELLHRSVRLRRQDLQRRRFHRLRLHRGHLRQAEHLRGRQRSLRPGQGRSERRQRRQL